MLNLLICINPCDSALIQPLRMAAHALDWGDSSNQRRRGGKQLTMVMIFVGGVVSVLDGIPVLFLPYKTYGAGFFCFRPNPNSG
jgi:hypothetical protein